MRGQLIAVIATGIGLLVIGVAGILSYEPLAIRWHIHWLENGDQEQRDLAAQKLADFGPRIIPELIKSLKRFDDPQTRNAVSSGFIEFENSKFAGFEKAFIKIGKHGAVQLISEIDKDGSLVTTVAHRALAVIFVGEYLKIQIRALSVKNVNLYSMRNDNKNCSPGAILLFAGSSDHRILLSTFEELLQFLQDDSLLPEIRGAAAQALKRLYGEKG